MKFYVFLAALVSAFHIGNAVAMDEGNVACTTEDYQELSDVLSTMTATNGESLRGEVQDMLMEEMGPSCAILPVGVGIPGNRYISYALESGIRSYVVTVVIGGVERPGTRLYIKKN